MKILNIATESIAIQNKAFFRTLVLAIKNYRASGRTTLDRSNLLRNLSLVITEHTNILVIARDGKGLGDNAFIVTPVINTNAVLNNHQLEGEVREIVRYNNKKRFDEIMDAWVDAKAAKVGGFFAKIPHTMVVGMELIENDKLYDEEMLAAIVLHEVGHAFTMLQFVADTLLTNIALENATRQFMAEKDYRKARVILDQTAHAVGDEEKQWAFEINEETSRDHAVRVFLMHTCAARLGTNNKRNYGYDNSEELADIFMVRHGAGEAMVRARLAFSKTMARDGIARYNRLSTYFMNLSTFLVAATGVVVMAGMQATVGIAGLMAPFVLLPLASISKDLKSALNSTDIATTRTLINKLRNQMVSSLKESDIGSEESKELLKSLDFTIAVLSSKIEEIDPGILQAVIGFFSSDRKDRRASREYTDRLENLVANDLFIKAYKLQNA